MEGLKFCQFGHCLPNFGMPKLFAKVNVELGRGVTCGWSCHCSTWPHKTNNEYLKVLYQKRHGASHAKRPLSVLDSIAYRQNCWPWCQCVWCLIMPVDCGPVSWWVKYGSGHLQMNWIAKIMFAKESFFAHLPTLILSLQFYPLYGTSMPMQYLSKVKFGLIWWKGIPGHAPPLLFETLHTYIHTYIHTHTHSQVAVGRQFDTHLGNGIVIFTSSIYRIMK